MSRDEARIGLPIGQRIKALRKERGKSLAELAALAGLSEATLSRVENGQTLVSAHHLYMLSQALAVDITRFFGEEQQPIGNGIRSVCRRGEGAPLDTARYAALVLCTDLANKKMHPAINSVSLRTVEDAGGLSRHDGEEFVFVLEGVLVLASEFYEPLVLDAGDSVYFDSRMGHAYLAGGAGAARILVINTTEPPGAASAAA